MKKRAEKIYYSVSILTKLTLVAPVAFDVNKGREQGESICIQSLPFAFI